MKRLLTATLGVLAAASMLVVPGLSAQKRQVAINVALNTDITAAIVADLSTHGRIVETLPAIDALTMKVAENQLSVIRAKPYVLAANPDAVRHGSPVDTVPATSFVNGLNTWDLDAINVTNLAQGRTLTFTGEGVYVAVLDTGLLDSWRQYFPQQRIATQYAIAFSGGGGEVGNVPSLKNQWEHDQNSHGTHVTSTILGYSFRGTSINGVAPMATVIPVKVLGQTGRGWSSMIAAGIVYVTDLKKNELGGAPVVINMSLGGSQLDAVEKAAVDYAVANGVIVVASAGNEGDAGMGFPGAYAPVISVAASGWVGEWTSTTWWHATDVPEPISPDDFYIADFSSRQKPGQDLDVAAPGTWVVGPYQLQSGKTSYFFLGGTSMASPHVAGIAALMLQKQPALNQGHVETILEASAIALEQGCRNVIDPNVGPTQFCWGADATGAGLITADRALAGVLP